MIRAYPLSPHSAGFGMFEVTLGAEPESYPRMTSVEGFRRRLARLGELVRESDPEYDEVQAADGCTYDQSPGEIVGRYIYGRDGRNADYPPDRVFERLLVCVE